MLNELRELRRSGRLAEARAQIAAAVTRRHDERLVSLARQHEDFWWQRLAGPRVTLHRRGGDDVALVRRCWADPGFMQRFNRMAVALPDDDDALRALLHREHWSLPQEAGALHWTIESGGQRHGFVSITEWSLEHRRGEFLIGVLPSAGAWTALEAAHLAFDFFAHRARIERLTAYFYPDNLEALHMAEKLGFEREGVLRGHLRRSDGLRDDLIVAGLLLDERFFERTQRLRARLLGKALTR